MNINKIEELSKTYNEVALFFSKYEPQQCTPYPVSDDMPISDVKTIWKIFKPDSIVCTADDFVIWCETFMTTLSGYVHSYRKETVQDIIKYYFKSTLFAPDVTELLQCGDIFLVDLLEAFIKVTEFINGFVDRTEPGYYGLIDQYDSFKEGLGQEKREENYYTSEDIESCIQEMIANGRCGTIVNETIHDLVNDETLNAIRKVCKQSEPCSQLPEELDTNEAKELFANAIKAGFMDSCYQWQGTKYQAALFAEISSEKLFLKNKWKPFETLWNVKHLAQTRRESKERFGKVDKEKDIEKIFQ